MTLLNKHSVTKYNIEIIEWTVNNSIKLLKTYNIKVKQLIENKKLYRSKQVLSVATYRHLYCAF